MKNAQAWSFFKAQWLWVCVLAFTLSACGFHLKGMGQNSVATFQSIYFSQTTGVRGDVMQVLKQLLKASDVKMVGDAESAELVLALEPTIYQVSRTSISGQGDTTAELLKMSQAFRVHLPDSKVPLLTATANSYRDRRLDTGAALASSRELQDIQQQMAFDVANQIIDRINRAYQQKVGKPKASDIKALEESGAQP